MSFFLERDSVNINLLIPLIRKAELSRSEVQILTDILLTKHLDEVTDHFEWIEGRQDPVVKLKKQLAEKEKALTEEQEASQAFQNKLKELRSEYNSERARLTQACRQYDETILAKQGEIQNLHATNRHLIDSHVAEKQALTQKIQQLQAQVNDESLVIRKLQEDHNQTQNALQQELVNQGQQLEIHVGRLSEQLQEAQKNFEAQIHNKIQEADQLRASFNAELQKNRRYEEELRELREQQVQSQAKIKSLESRASQLKESNSHTQELLRQIEELQRTNKDLELRYDNSHKLEEEFKFEKNKLQKEVNEYTTKISKLQDDCESLRQECGKLLEKNEKMRTSKVDMETDFQRVKDENKCLISQVSAFTKVEREAQRLREENEILAAQVTAFTERPAADGRENGDSPYKEEKKQNINVEFINNETQNQTDGVYERMADELYKKDVQLEMLHSQLNGSESEIKRLTSEVANYKTEIPKLKLELQAQVNKNNDLRKKNWKAMEALAATEKNLEDNLRQTEKFIQVYEDWLAEFEKKAKNYVEQLTTGNESSTQSDSAQIEELENKNNQLQTLIVYYKTIIEDTEGMLKKLQSHIEQEEIRWRQQCEALEVQIQMQKDELAGLESAKAKLEAKVKELESKNVGEDQSVRQEYNELSEKCKNLSREIEILHTKLAGEEDKNKELNKEVVKLRSTVKFGQDAYVEENKKRLELEDEIKLLKNENIRDLPINSSGDFVAYEKGGFERQ
ncbi:hypothetical protein RUM43_007938 [Polyplax serrata]|uniref:Uncharacterized protein n=1 Tax=Polyplax serrata TaxID=468196 RepID=A0AAN8P9P8_POLSC